jgi:hypothetical protein
MSQESMATPVHGSKAALNSGRSGFEFRTAGLAKYPLNPGR